jgi:hypothetical protein
MNHAQITHRFSFLRGACVVCIIRRWNERGLSVIVSGCESKAVCAWFWVLNGSNASVCVIHESACVVYVSSMRDYARETRRPSVLMRRNWFETAHVHVRPLTPLVHITHEPRTYRVHSTDNHLQNLLVRGTFAKRASLDALLQWFLRRACVGYSWNTAPYLLVCVDVRDMSVIVSNTCAVHAWFVSDLYPRHPEKLVNFSTHKHAQTQSVRDLWVIRAWSAVRLSF